MTTWTQKYLKEAISDEIELARLLNYGKLVRPAALTMYTLLQRAGGARIGQGTLGSSGDAGTSAIPVWRRNWGAAGSLTTKLFLHTKHDVDEGTVSVGASGQRRCVTESYQDHPSVDAATWAAIVRASIQVLTEMRDSQ
jgi:hypothetical protein